MACELTQARLRELLHYDPLTGVFTRVVDVGPRKDQKAGSVAGGENQEGYVQIQVDGKHYLAHRLAWFYVHGEWPEPECDHKDTIRNHNWLDNLRPATRSENEQNQRKARGVYWNKPNSKWHAQIKLNGRSKHLGYFSTAEAAHAAYLTAKRKLHKGCTL